MLAVKAVTCRRIGHKRTSGGKGCMAICPTYALMPVLKYSSAYRFVTLQSGKIEMNHSCRSQHKQS